MSLIRRVYKCEIPETVGSVTTSKRIEHGVKTMDTWRKIYSILHDNYDRKKYFLQGDISLVGIIKNELKK